MQSEYVADADKRREFVSGFNGSAGKEHFITNTGAFVNFIHWQSHFHVDYSMQ